MLSKSEYKLGLTCPKELWLSRHEPGAQAPPSTTAQRRMRIGTEVGQLAKKRFPNGQTIPVWELSNEQAAVRTLEMMATGIETIFEATFIFGELVARIDVLQREADGWRIIEVKATSKYKKPDHLPDVSFQAHIVKGLGHPLTGVSLMHLNPEYVWQGGKWDVNGLFEIDDVSSDVEKAMPEVPGKAEAFLAMLEETAYPPAEGVPPYFDPVIFAQCKECAFAGHCSGRVPGDHIYFLGLHHSKTKKLLAEGIRSIGDLPIDFAMTNAERLRFDAFRNGEPSVAPELAARLGEIQYPAHLIDCETLRPELPLFIGHAPFIMLPFQWSCHTLEAAPNASTMDQNHSHREFLHRDRSDPREAFIQSLLAQLEFGGSILHYHGFEKNVINEMAADGVPGADQLVAKFDRFIDLRKILEDCYADAGFLGKTSIKNVLPVVAPSLSYSSLNIKNGDQAQIEYGRMLSGEATQGEADKLFIDLLAYCKLDTWAMVEILKVLIERASSVRLESIRKLSNES